MIRYSTTAYAGFCLQSFVCQYVHRRWRRKKVAVLVADLFWYVREEPRGTHFGQL